MQETAGNTGETPVPRVKGRRCDVPKRSIKVGLGRSIFENRPKFARRGLRPQPATMTLKPPAAAGRTEGAELQVPETTVVPETRDSEVQRRV